MSDTTVHLAGNAVQIGGRIIQRCLVCGYKLIDIPDCYESMMTGESEHIGVWDCGMMVAVSEYGYQQKLFLTRRPHFSEPWRNSCLSLVEAECE